MEGSVDTVYKGDAERLKPRIDISELLSEEYFARETEKVFRRSWLLAGKAYDLPKTGSYFVREVPSLDASVIVVRGADGEVRGFHNICTHRGNKVVNDDCGCRSSFYCRFHGWLFSPEGELTHVTDEQQFRGLDKGEMGLIPVHVGIWEDHVFINLDETPAQSLAEWLGPMHGEYGGYFQSQGPAVLRSVSVNCNWSLAINAFQEGYHTKYIHAAAVPDYQGGAINPERHRPFMEMFERHQRYSAPANPDHVITRAEEVAWRYGRQVLPAFDGDMTGMPVGVNPDRAENWAFDVVHLFPNTLMLLGNHWHIELTFWPIDVDNTLITGGNYAYPAKDLGERLSQDFSLSRGRFIVREDLSTLEAQHAVLKSGKLSHFHLSQQEMALQHHYHVLADMVNGA
jgi:phenylpropionate dioxygenase-like ring-hydroxylating dioxygenase large terminal subunit